jgi:WD40 repeat protein
LVCSNTNRISRIFRDESELPTSGDLGQDITAALENSSFLIVLCSTKLKESKWCMREIEYFKEIHGGRINRILPILIDGHPTESFPETLRYDVITTVTENGATLREVVEVEPLACNIVSSTHKETVKKLNTEFLRIAAPIFGCGFDDLYRRHRRRKIRRMITAGTSAAALTALFTATVIFQNIRVQNQRYHTYAESSVNAKHEGNIPQAVSYALSALPDKTGLLHPAPLSRAIKALSDALGIYDLSEGYRPHRAITLPAKALHVALSEDGRTGAAVYAYEVAVFDTETAEIIAVLPTARSMLCEAYFLHNHILIYAGANGISAYDTARRTPLWSAEMATSIAISADKTTVATVYLEETHATVYDTNGVKKATVPFGGRKQRVAVHDMFGNPRDNLFALSPNGTWLAASFSDGSLTVFNLPDESKNVSFINESDFIRFGGGFSRDSFAFTASNISPYITGDGFSYFAAVDMAGLFLTDELEHSMRLGFLADDTGVYVSYGSAVERISAATGDVTVARTTEDVAGFALNENFALVTTNDNGYSVFNKEARLLQQYAGNTLSDLVALRGDYGIIAGQDSPTVNIIKKTDRKGTEILRYDNTYIHDEARINEARTRAMLFSFTGFRIYGMDGTLLNETPIPDSNRIYDQQYSQKSGNLSVIYWDALRIYSGDDGRLLLEMTDLKSVFHAPYGISVLSGDGRLSLVNPDTAQAQTVASSVNGTFAAWCGMVVDSSFLGNRELIGATKEGESYRFAVSEGFRGAVYDGGGKKLFDVDTGHNSEAHFAGGFVFISPFNGTPAAYDLKTGKKAGDLGQDGYLTYVTAMDGYIVSEYLHVNGERFGLLLDGKTLEPVANLPRLADIHGGRLIFNFESIGVLRESGVYSLGELKAKAFDIR